MSQVSTGDVIELFKKVYGNLSDLQPEDYYLQKKIPFSAKQKVGEEYKEAVVLTAETGWTLGGSGTTAFNLNPARAGSVRQTSVTPSVSVLPSVVPWTVISRSAEQGPKSFFNATKYIVKNNLKSHGKLQEIMRLYGRSNKQLGSVSYATATYRGVSLTNGSGTLVSDYFGSLAFVNGVVSSGGKHYMLMAPGQFAAGFWVGSEGVEVVQQASGVEVASGKLTGVDPDLGILELDSAMAAATAADSHIIGFRGMESSLEMQGMQSILSTAGSLFGIDNSAYSLWQGTRLSLSSAKLTLELLQTAIARAVNRAGLEGNVTCLVNPRTWATMVTDEDAKRSYDDSYKPGSAEAGWKSIKFYHQAGEMEIVSHRYVKEGDAFVMRDEDWSRSGSAEIGFSIPGMEGGKQIIFPLENQAGYAFRSFADQYIFCHAPGRSIYIDGINDEA